MEVPPAGGSFYGNFARTKTKTHVLFLHCFVQTIQVTFWYFFLPSGLDSTLEPYIFLDSIIIVKIVHDKSRYFVYKLEKMFKNTFQSGFLSILYSIGSNPLQIWDKKVKNGIIKRVTDQDIQSLIIEITGSNVATTYITCPCNPRLSLGIKLPYLVMIVKNLKKFFSFEIEILDDKGVKRRFRSSNYQTVTRVRDQICSMPLRLDEGWNQITFNLTRLHEESVWNQLPRDCSCHREC